MQSCWFGEEDKSGFASLLEACEAQASAIVGEFADSGASISARSETAARKLAALVASDLRAELRKGAAGEPAGLEELLTRVGVLLAEAGVGARDYWQLLARGSASIKAILLRVYARDPERARAALSVAERSFARISVALAESELAIKERMLGEERRRAEQALLRFSRLFEAKILGILVCDLVGNILEANDGFLEMVGYTREELLSGRVRWVEMTPPEYKQLDDDAVEQLKVRGVTRPWEKEYIRKDGTRVPILVGVAMLNETECVAFVLDITERKRLEELRQRSAELEAQNRRIREASRLKSEFLANMSHELRTPLNSIIGFAELLHDGAVDKDSAQHQEFLGDILSSGRHLLQLINDVLDLAKVEAGKMDFRPESVDVEQLVVEVCAVLRSIAASKRIELTSTVAPEVRHVKLDPARLKQVLYNYASNAIKFTPEGGRVVLRARAEGDDSIAVEVEDNGVGIASSDFERLFVEFQQLDPTSTKRQGGTGLGLALTKRIVEAQGGSVAVQSTLGQGSLFSAILPRHSDVANEQVAAIAIGRRHAGASAVLVVEDDPRDGALIVNTLSRAGYDVEIAGTGQEAVNACRERSFDAITLDLLLPDTTGLEVLHRIREDGKNRATPILVVTVVAERGVVGGFAVEDYLQKPVNGRDLLVALQRAGVPPDKSGTILVVDDDPAALKLMDTTLRTLGYNAQVVSNAESALMLASARRPLAVILDLLMPGVDGFAFLLRFRAIPENASVPVVVWTMKDLSSDDHERLRQLSQAVIAKGTGSLLLDQLRALLPSASPAEEGGHLDPSHLDRKKG
ncbi:MAG: PAS domain-containing hybrid sensor histidine kinase/response regulator [Myxococcota bacterium]